MLTSAYSGQPLPTHCSAKFTTVLRGSHGFGVLRHDSMGNFASSPPGGVTPHSARKVQKMLASGISSELRAHQMAPGGVVPHSSPPARVAAHSSPFELSPQLFPFFRDAIFVNALPVDEMGSQSVLRDGLPRTGPVVHHDGWTRVQSSAARRRDMSLSTM